MSKNEATTIFTIPDFKIPFNPQPILEAATEELKRSFKYRAQQEIEAFCGEPTSYTGQKLVKTPGAGLLMIRDFLEKKFDDPATQVMMQTYFDKNFDRIMGEAMEKALQHKANTFVFGKAKEKTV